MITFIDNQTKLIYLISPDYNSHNLAVSGVDNIQVLCHLKSMVYAKVCHIQLDIELGSCQPTL